MTDDDSEDIKNWGVGRPPLEIDEDEVFRLAKMQCTNQEIADFFDCATSTIERRFAAALKRGRSVGVMSMKRRLFEKVEKGDLGAMVWWGKNYADMSEKIEQKIESKQETHFKIGWADESDQLNPPEKDATPTEDSSINEEIQTSSLGAPERKDD